MYVYIYIYIYHTYIKPIKSLYKMREFIYFTIVDIQIVNYKSYSSHQV